MTGLLPHTGPARLLCEVVRNEVGFIEASGRVSVSHPLVVAGRAPCFLGLELGAQAAAALESLRREARGERPIESGYLVRVREAVFLTPDLPVETTLCVTARLEGAVPPLAVHRICVSAGGVDCVRAVLGTVSAAR